MADKKISQLPAVTTPLEGTAVLPVVQAGVAKKVTVNELLSPAAGNGINFGANIGAPGMTSELLNWYEEGTWTPVFDNLTVGSAIIDGRYTRVGRMVTVSIRMQFGAGTAWTGTCANIAGLPYASPNRANGPMTMFRTGVGWYAGQVMIYEGQSQTSFPTDANGTALSATTPWTWASGDFVVITITYEA